MSGQTIPHSSTPPAAPAAGAAAAGAAQVPATPAPASSDFASMIPAEFKDKPYLKDVKDLPSVLKMLDGAQSLIGKPRVPKADAPEAEWKAFHKELGVPEKFEDYQFEIPETEKATRLVDVDTKVKQIFHKAGLSAKQAKEVQVAYDALVREMNTDFVKKQNDSYDAIANKIWGDKRADKEKNALNLLSELGGPELMPLLDGMPNEALLFTASILDTLHTKLRGEDPKIPRGSGGGNAPVDNEQIRAKAREIMASEAFKNQTHPGHDQAVAEKNALYAKLK